MQRVGNNSMIKFIPKSASTALFSLILAAIALLFALGAQSSPSADFPGSEKSYLGFDRNIYPGDGALPILRKTFAFSGYWLSPPPGEKNNTWSDKRELLRSQGFGFVVLYRGPDSSELKTQAVAKSKGPRDGDDAAASAKAEGFSSGTVVFLDIEEGGRLPETYHTYLAAWSEALVRGGFHPGVYCSGIPVKEGPKISITTADDIRHHSPTRDIAVWVYNDACPPSPGCAFPHDPPLPGKSGIHYASIWQFAQSPRRKGFTSRCARTYLRDGNCYAPGDTVHSWFLDVNIATSPDPSGGTK